MRVTETIGPAWETMKRLLFRPFNLGTWFSFGLVFAFQSCAEGGGGGNFRIPDLGGHGSSPRHGRHVTDALSNVIPDVLSAARGDFAGIGPSELLVIGAILTIVLIPTIFVMLWLGSRGQMMAIRAVSIGRPDFGEAWAATKSPGGRMFAFHMALVAIGLVVFLPLIGGGIALCLPALRRNEGFATLLPILVPLALVAVLAVIPFAIVGSLGRNFVAPIMLKHDVGAREAWRRFWSVARGHVGAIVTFWVVGFGFRVVAGIAGLIGGLLTCCLGFLPILNQTLMAPYLVFERAWTLEILASLSPDFDCRALPPPDPPPGGFGYGGYPPGPGYGGPPAYGPPGGGFGAPPPAGGFGGPYGR